MSGRSLLKAIWVLSGVALLSACSSPPSASPAGEAVDSARFVAGLSPHCERAFVGRVAVDQPPTPEAIWREPMVLHLRCEGSGRLLALSLGEDRSRVWLLGPTAAGLRLSHMHHHQDGEPADVSGYGGLATQPAASAHRVEFSADQATQQLFRAHGMDEAAANVWALELVGENTLVYELKRPGRLFRLEFDLSRPVPPPPLPWAEVPVI